MRCSNCNYENPSSFNKCVKCGNPLKKEAPVSDKNFNTENESAEDTGAMKTIIGKKPQDGYIDAPAEKNDSNKKDVNSVKKNINCPNCGYPNAFGALKCLNCKLPLNVNITQPEEEEEKDNDLPPVIGGTENPWTKAESKKCFLKPVAREGESEKSVLEFSNKKKETLLVRNNTDPENENISATSQAQLSFKDGKWFIQDKSRHKTTFVHVSQPFELKKGDIILLGNRLFKFDC